jgi:hypothetical protein
LCHHNAIRQHVNLRWVTKVTIHVFGLGQAVHVQLLAEEGNENHLCSSHSQVNDYNVRNDKLSRTCLRAEHLSSSLVYELPVTTK